MRIVDVRMVQITRALPVDRTASRGPSRSSITERAFPINHHPDIPRLMASIPGRSPNRAWVQVTVEDGTWGIGWCDWPHLVEPLILDIYAPLIAGRDVFATELLNDLMWRTAQPFGPSGLAAIARSAVDLALWDVKGRLLEQPVHRLLGGPVREEIPLYATTDDIEWALELGFEAIKLTNPVHYSDGSKGLDLLEDHVGNARDLVGDGVDLMFNPVMSFNVEFAARVAERLRPFNLRWIEEPLIPSDLDGHAELRRIFSPTPLATGEHLHGRHAFADLIDRRGVDIIQPDVLWCGGLTEAVKIATLGEAAGLSVIPHFSGSTPFGVHLAATLTECPVAEYWLTSDPGIPLDRIGSIPGTPVPVGGRIRPSDAPGMGYELGAVDLAPWSRR
jgi:L-rhamnonate dehydratase